MELAFQSGCKKSQWRLTPKQTSTSRLINPESPPLPYQQTQAAAVMDGATWK